jgi:hypothetical protein
MSTLSDPHGSGATPAPSPNRSSAPSPAAETVGSTLDPDVVVLLEVVPEFIPTYRSLLEAFDDDPEGPVVFTELADFVSDRLGHLDSPTVLDRVLAVVESVVLDDVDGSELVAYAFLDSLSPDDRRRIVPWLGPATRRLLDELDVVDHPLDDAG